MQFLFLLGPVSCIDMIGVYTVCITYIYLYLHLHNYIYNYTYKCSTRRLKNYFVNDQFPLSFMAFSFGVHRIATHLYTVYHLYTQYFHRMFSKNWSNTQNIYVSISNEQKKKKNQADTWSISKTLATTRLFTFELWHHKIVILLVIYYYFLSAIGSDTYLLGTCIRLWWWANSFDSLYESYFHMHTAQVSINPIFMRIKCICVVDFHIEVHKHVSYRA